FGISDSAAHYHYRFGSRPNNSYSLFKLIFDRQRAQYFVHPLCKKFFGVIVCFALHVLRERDRHGARVGGVREHAHCVYKGAHNLFGTGDAVKVTRYRPVSVVGGDKRGIELLYLLKHGVGLTGSERISAEEKQ